MVNRQNAFLEVAICKGVGMSKVLHWGIIGLGNIAHQFAAGVVGGAKRSEIVGVGSRSEVKAKEFMGVYGIDDGRAYGSYEELIGDERVDAVYLALPNSIHYEWVIKALDAGKHVLCEKPLARDVGESEEMFDVAERAGLVLIEAFMYRCHPLTKAVCEAVWGGEIGELKMVRTSFCYCTKYVEGNTRFDLSLAGGGLMDIGCYCVDFMRLIVGEEPVAVKCVGHFHESGVDDYAGGCLEFPCGVVGVFGCGMRAQANNATMIQGTKGYIEVPVPWKPDVKGAKYIVRSMVPPRQDLAAGRKRKGDVEVVVDADRPLYALEADRFAEAVLDGKERFMTREDTLGNMAVLDRLRGEIGLEFG